MCVDSVTAGAVTKLRRGASRINQSRTGYKGDQMRNGSSKTAGSAARERRREVRAPARIEVRFQEASQAALAFRAYSLNFSVGGLCLLTRNKYAIGTDLKLALTALGAAHHLPSALPC